MTADLLDAVLTAHGGLDRWDDVTGLSARMSFGGPFWGGRGWGDVLQAPVVDLDTRTERISFTPFSERGSAVTYEVSGGRERLAVLDADGRTTAEREAPRTSFPVYGRDTPWDEIQTAYFVSVASWNYLTEPFLFARPDVQSVEVDPWEEDGETWRRLAVTFPLGLPNHNLHQTFYFDDQFHLRRMDYHPDVTDSAIAHYTEQPTRFDGFLFYASRFVYPRLPDNHADKRLAVITIETQDVAVRRAPR